MPVVTITLIKGYEEETRQRLSEAVTDAVRTVIAAPLEGVTVITNEVEAANYMRGKARPTPGKSVPNAKAIILGFLEAMAARDIEHARTFLSDDFAMTFPGDNTFISLDEFVAWAATRYREIRKTYQHFDQIPTDEGSVIYCCGTLEGIWLDSRPFSGIRFVDRFEVQIGKIKKQQVWNDIAEARLQDSQSEI